MSSKPTGVGTGCALSASDPNGEKFQISGGELALPAAGSSAGSTFVARQPIFDHNKRVYGYELLFRSSQQSREYDAPDGDTATSEVIANTVFACGRREILRNNRGFFNFTREHLFVDYSSILAPNNTVVELLETIEPDDAVIQACRRLKANGYTLALDDFIAKDRFNPLTKYADIIKVDFRGTDPSEQNSLASRFRPQGVTMLAEKVETAAEFRMARSLGYSLFQGYFFAHPEIVSGKRIPAFKKHYHQLLQAIHRPDFDYSDIESVIKKELSLTYKLLLYLNSARFGWLSRINSIRHALVLLGAQEVRTWASLAIVASLGEDKPAELLLTGAIRTQFCELLGAQAGLKTRPDSLFMLGMFSVMDAIMEQPLVEVLAEIQVEREVLDALLGIAGPENRMALVYQIVRGYEVGDWQTVFACAIKLGIRPNAIPPLYAEAVQWAENVFASEAKPSAAAAKA